MNIQEIRAKYPQYGDLSDDQLGKALHAKFYADMPFDDFAQKVGLSVKAKAESPITGAEELAGNPLTRFALGAASPFLGAAQLGAEALGDKTGSETLRQLEEMKKRGMVANERLQSERAAKIAAAGGFSQTPTPQQDANRAPDGAPFDVSGLAGTVMSPAVLAAMKIPAAASVLGRAGQGAAIGAGLGAASPVTSEGDFASAKAAQIGTGALIGGLVPPAIDAVRAVGSKAIDILAPIFGGSRQRAAKILADIVGEKRPQVEAELSKPNVLVPGSQPTGAEAASAAGSTELSGLQRNVASQLQPSQYSDIGKAQEAARRASIQSF